MPRASGGQILLVNPLSLAPTQLSVFSAAVSLTFVGATWLILQYSDIRMIPIADIQPLLFDLAAAACRLHKSGQKHFDAGS